VEKLTHNYGVDKRYIHVLLDRFEDQKQSCFYTGVPLVPGINASLDHYFCKADHPHLASDPDNLVWCDIAVNFMKRNLTPDKLLLFAEALVARKAEILAGVPVRPVTPLVPA
jgi:hypothetical protein